MMIIYLCKLNRCTILIQLVCSSHDYYIVTHNVSSDKSPLIVNRNNVTLYGVQPGEMYTVKITPNSTKVIKPNGNMSKEFIFSASVCDPTIQQMVFCGKESEGM